MLIVGAGLAGSLAACYLLKAGWKVEIIERRADPRRAGYSGGRSINLALSARGLDGLRGVGLDRAVMDQEALPMKGRMVHARDGGVAFHPYSSDPGDAIYSVTRGGLNIAILNEAERLGASVLFNATCQDVNFTAPEVTFRHNESGEHFVVAADLVLGADGAFSAVRGLMQKTDRFDYQQSFLAHGYKELHIPPAEACGVDPRRFNGFALDPNALHIWPHRSAMMIALPNRDRSFTCTLFWPFRGEHAFEALQTPEQIRGFFARHYGDAIPLMPTLVEDFQKNPTSALVTVRCWPWHVNGRVALIGDSAHAIVPFFGQGMNCAFEDVKCLAECLTRFGKDHAAALDEYQRRRKPAAEAIADLALDNFVEMRDKVGSSLFVARKRLEHTLHEAFPSQFLPLYGQVSFSTVPYQQARARARTQAMVLRAALGLVFACILAPFMVLASLTTLATLGLALVAGWFLADWLFAKAEARFDHQQVKW